MSINGQKVTESDLAEATPVAVIENCENPSSPHRCGCDVDALSTPCRPYVFSISSDGRYIVSDYYGYGGQTEWVEADDVSRMLDYWANDADQRDLASRESTEACVRALREWREHREA